MNFWALLTTEQWAALSSLGTAASSLIAFFGLFFIGLQIRAARRTADLQALQEFLRSTTERETALYNAPDENRRESAFFEFANFLELQAAALRGGLFSRVTRNIVREKIRDSLAFIELTDPWMHKLHEARSSPTAFEHLFHFMKRERRRIDAVKEAYQLRNCPEVQHRDASR